jgi:hypothetical protein
MTITGTIQNTGTQTTGETWVIATFYNSTQGVVSMGISNLAAETLAPGGSAQFTVSPIEDTGGALSQISNYSLIIQTAQPSGTPTPLSTPPASSITTPTPTLSASTSTQPTSPTAPFNYSITLTIVALVAIAVAVLAFVLLFRERHKTSKNNP